MMIDAAPRKGTVPCVIGGVGSVDGWMDDGIDERANRMHTHSAHRHRAAHVTLFPPCLAT
jgi:hypothetical protein